MNDDILRITRLEWFEWSANNTLYGRVFGVLCETEWRDVRGVVSGGVFGVLWVAGCLGCCMRLSGGVFEVLYETEWLGVWGVLWDWVAGCLGCCMRLSGWVFGVLYEAEWPGVWSVVWGWVAGCLECCMRLSGRVFGVLYEAEWPGVWGAEACVIHDKPSYSSSSDGHLFLLYMYKHKDIYKYLSIDNIVWLGLAPAHTWYIPLHVRQTCSYPTVSTPLGDAGTLTTLSAL